jgi:tetratricopeptide (TPR) repeat protein
MCIGEYAETPYYIEKVYVNVYSAEELCYVIYENAFLLDKDILDRKLTDWIDKQLKLHDLARDLTVLINQNASAAAFAGTILSYVGFYSKDEISRVESILRMNVSMNVFEKWKAKADFLVENRHFVLAISEYEKLLKSLPDNETMLQANIYNNLGIAYLKLYLFDSAEKCFMSSYETDNNEEAYRNYLTVKRLSLSDDDYIRLIAEEERAYKTSILIETDMDEATKAFELSDAALELKDIYALKNTNESSRYYDSLLKLTEELKDDYRDIVLEAAKQDNPEEE